MERWYDHELARRATADVDEFGKHYRKGEFLPFYVPRLVMPQVDEEFYPQLFDFAKQNGVEITQHQTSPDEIVAHQHITVDHAVNMLPEVLVKPILTSREPYIVDGHHRWYMHHKLGSPINEYRFGSSFTETVKLLFSFPSVYAYGDGNEHPFTY